ncbi:hypothetical protein L905_19220 [Agrobacterium sp. TS43]|uniref:fibronectin type III domain-containing protein n=1 Tax=Agrobacterium TaxID=357 RepID=UPI00049FD0B2|nr:MULTISPECIES: fibronectin type III domain-containing protein [Agrobacterium]KDR87725.1 hypothetical protein K538_07190 [Agrobacterium tumefaciens GW4]KVK49523.1 hypothetical protein L903_19580 [Agrobacterium sp. JL28]KVK49760.1 hypothetical protein L904_19570 [Agrobacterium sp. LY4]KVK62701.1 hypothetical protein L906_18695 [Agrobacterium sp. TS45]KVK65086.1 hypothetical protein L905_19220 [Agrobacterium sp. TS43]
MPIGPVDLIKNGESGASVRAKLNLLLQGAIDGSLGSVTPEDLDALVDTIAPERPKDFELNSTLVPSNLLIGTWAPSLEDDFAYYELQLKQGLGSWIGYQTSSTMYQVSMIPNTVYTGRVFAVDKSGNKSEPSVEFTHTTVADEIPPAMPVGLTASGGINNTWLKWIANTETDFARYEIFEALEEFPAPTDESTPSYTSQTNAFVIAAQDPEITRWYWVRAVDTSGNKSPWSAPAFATTSKIRSEVKVTLVGILFKPGNAPNGNRLTWTAGQITFGTDGSVPTSQNIPSGFVDFTGPTLYVYYVLGDNKFSVTTSLVTMYSQDSVLLGVYRGGNDYQSVEGKAYIDGGTILAQTIGANQLVADQAVITGAAQIANAIITNAHIVELSAAKLMAGTALAGSITVSGHALGDVADYANDPAGRINEALTQIDPGKILISGGTSLADWRSGGDNTKINGGNIATNSVRANVLEIGARGVTATGIAFSGNTPTSNRVSWTAGTITYLDDTGATVEVVISENPIGAMWTDATIYIYWAKGASSLSSTTLPSTAFASNNIVLATYKGGLNLSTDYGRTIIDGQGIKTGTVGADQIAANAIRAQHIAADAIQAGHLQAGIISTDKLAAGAVTAAKMSVGSLSAISAVLGYVDIGDANISRLTVGTSNIAAGAISDAFETSQTGSNQVSLTVNHGAGSPRVYLFYSSELITQNNQTGAAIRYDINNDTDGGVIGSMGMVNPGVNNNDIVTASSFRIFVPPSGRTQTTFRISRQALTNLSTSARLIAMVLRR